MLLLRGFHDADLVAVHRALLIGDEAISKRAVLSIARVARHRHHLLHAPPTNGDIGYVRSIPGDRLRLPVEEPANVFGRLRNRPAPRVLAGNPLRQMPRRTETTV